MRTVIQRVTSAEVSVEGAVVGRIGRGAVVLAGFAKGDAEVEVMAAANRVAGLRHFDDGEGKMGKTVKEVEGALLVIPNFTLVADLSKGRKPSFDPAAPPDQARVLFDLFVRTLRGLQIPVETGTFGAHMHVRLENDGPVTFVL